MSLIMKNALKVAVTTSAKTIDINCRDFLLCNVSDAVVYVKELEEDGKAVTVDTGFAILPKTMTHISMNASKLSLIGAAAGEVRILFVEEG